MLWLLEPTTLRRLIHAQETFRDPEAAIRWEAEQAAQVAEAEQRDGLPQGLQITGSTATINVEGVLTKRPDFWAKFFGGSNTTYSSIRNALAYASSSAEVGEIVFSVDSPGGNSEGLIELLDSIAYARQAAHKPMRVSADNAQSAAYGIAAAVGKIEARGRGGVFGSIGTAASFYLPSNVVTLTNTDSPDKRPDLTTPEGKAVVVKYLDQINHEFVSAIAQGRGVTLGQVSEGYGRGASMTATEAKRLGLIDSIATTAPRAVPSSKVVSMADKDQETEAAKEAATQRGVEQERDRVLAHLTMGESCGDMTIALEAIRSGAGMSQAIQARYLSAGMNRADRGKRQTESNTAEVQLAGVAASSPVTPSTADLGDQVVSVLKSQGGEKSFVRA
jgi:ClpP class serine protease